MSLLFSEFKLGPLTLRNRIVSTGHDTTMSTDGLINQDIIAYHRARAAGGAGLIVCQVVGVHETARYTNHVLMGVDDSCIDGFRDLADAVHEEGGTLFAQLFHPGSEILELHDGMAAVAWGPSATPSERFHVVPRAMTTAMVEEVIAGYGSTAARLHRAGVDGVELVASHGYLPSQFLNPLINKRTDAYGGSDESRLRFLVRAVEATRAAVPDSCVVGLRISGDERYDNGMQPDQALSAIRAVAADLDYVSVVAGSSSTLGAAVHIVPPMYETPGYVAPFADQVKRATGLPVIVTGRLNQPQEAEKVLASGAADLCGMTRAMICDPEMPNKAQAGRFDDIRACIGCNQACIGRFQKGAPISCIQHPETGRERTFAPPKIAQARKKVMVIGGGPGGMKAAAAATERGHTVTLYEAGAQLGGQARLAQMLPGRAEFGGIITNLSRELEQSGAQIRTRTRVDASVVARDAPDAILLATGAAPRWPDPFHHDGDGQVVDGWQVLRNEVNIGGSVLIADWKGDWTGVGLAELLAEKGCHVRLAVNGLYAGQHIQNYARDAIAARLHRLGIKIIPYARLFGRDADSVFLQHTASGEPIIVESVDTLVSAHALAPVWDLPEKLTGFPGPVVPIGDCLSPRSCEEAVYEGLKAAVELDQ